MNVVFRLGICLLLCLTIACSSHRVTGSDDLVWQSLPELPQPLSGQFAGVSNGTLLVVGGTDFPVPLFSGGQKVWYDAVYVLEPGKSQWRRAMTLNHTLAYGGSITTDDGVICLGGSDSTQHYAEVFSLSYVNGQIEKTRLPNLPQPCAMMSAAQLGHTIYVAGGQLAPNSTTALKTFQALDLSAADPQWQQLEPWPGPARILPVVVAQNGAVYVISGAELSADASGRATRRYLSDGYAYRPGKGWQRIADVPRPVVAAPALAFGSSHIFVMGGDDGANAGRVQELKDRHPGFSRETLMYHTRANTWAKAGSYPDGLVTSTAVLWQNRIVIPGGEDRPGHRMADVIAASFNGRK